jgi:hypothetical protein
MPENVIIVFEIKPGPADNQIILKDNAFINSNPIIFSYDGIISDYPFMALSTEDTINFIEKRQNDYILHCIINNRNDNVNSLHRLIREKHDNYYISFHIKQNFFTPFIDNNKKLYMNIFYNIFSPIKNYVKNFQYGITKNYKTKLHNLLGLDVLSDIKKKGRLEEILEEIFTETRRNINKIINRILLEENRNGDEEGNRNGDEDENRNGDEDEIKKVPYINLVEWINKNANNSLIEDKDKLNCKLDCLIIKGSQLKTEIKNAKYNSKNLSDEERRLNAENIMNKLAALMEDDDYDNEEIL